MTTKDICEMFNVTPSLANTFARKNGLKGVQINGTLRMTYEWTPEDIEKFKNRRGRGKPRTKPLKKKIKRTTLKANNVLSLLGK